MAINLIKTRNPLNSGALGATVIARDHLDSS
jgi:hypothetical protein